MPKQSHSMLKSKHLEHSSEEYEIELFSYIDLLNYMLKYKIPQIVTLTLQIYHHDNTLIDIKTEKGSINH